MSNIQVVSSLAMQQTVSNDVLADWVKYLDAKPRTVSTYSKAVKQFLLYLKENDIQQPERENVINWREKLRREGRKPTTIQNYITAVRLFFRWTSQRGIYPNIADHIKGATLDREHKKDYLTGKQVKIILDSIDRNTDKGLRDYAIVSLMVTCGLRDIEVARADIQDMRAAGNYTALYIQGKGRDEKGDFVKLTAPIEAAIRAYLRTRPDAGPDSPLFTSISNRSEGERLTTRSISRIVKTIFKNAGFSSDRLTAHSLRHTAVTLSLLAGNSLQDVQQFARHTNISTTQIYAHNIDRANSKCEESIAKAIFK